MWIDVSGNRPQNAFMLCSRFANVKTASFGFDHILEIPLKLNRHYNHNQHGFNHLHTNYYQLLNLVVLIKSPEIRIQFSRDSNFDLK